MDSEQEDAGAVAGAGARSAAMHCMPSRSRQGLYKTLRRRRPPAEGGAEAEAEAEAEPPAEVIVRELEQQSALMEDNPRAEELRREALRSLPEALALRRSVGAALGASVRRAAARRPLGRAARLRLQLAFGCSRGWARGRAALGAWRPWRGALQAIEGQFGSGVGAYFRMLRRLLLLDAALAALLLALVVLPQALHAGAGGRAPLAGAGGRAPLAGAGGRAPLAPLDWLTGQGAVGRSLLFFGSYSDGPVLGGAYYMPAAYLLTAALGAAATLARLGRGAAVSYRRHFIDAGGARSLLFANKLFCGWDFGVTAPRAARDLARAIRTDLLELLRERAGERERASAWARAGRWATNAAVNAAVLGAIGGALWGLRALLARGGSELARAAAVTALAALSPALLHAAARLERYGSGARLYVTLARAWLLQTGLMLTLLLHWARSETECWENSFGQEIYRLLVLETFVSLAAMPAAELCRRALCGSAGGAGELRLTSAALSLGYNQALAWWGLCFAPALGALLAAKLLLLFYAQRALLRVLAPRPATKLWRAAGTQTALQLLVALQLFAALLGVGATLLRMPSPHCGPFREYAHVYEVLSEGVLRLSARPGLARALHALARPAVIAFLLLLLGLAVVYARGVAHARRGSARALRRVLALQAGDKEFLLAAIQRVASGEWRYGARAAPGAHTQRFARDVRKPSNCEFQLHAARDGAGRDGAGRAGRRPSG